MKRTPALTALAAVLVATALALIPASPASASFVLQVTGRASVLSGAVEPSLRGDSTDTAISGDGRYVVFGSDSALVPADVDTVQDVYLKDLLTDRVERISVTTDGSPASGDSFAGAVSSDGRFVAFWSWATDLVPGDTKGKADVFVRDRLLGTTERVSVTSGEAEANGASPSIINGDSLGLTDDGRYVAFTSSATNLGADANTLSDVFVRDRVNGTTTLVSVSSAEAVAGSDSYGPTISANGRYVAFESDATNLVAPDTNAGRDVYVRDLTAGTTARVSLADNDTQPGGQSFTGWISDDGARVAFASTSKLTPADTNATSDVYVRTIASGSTKLISAVPGSGSAAGNSRQPRIAGLGSTVAFVSSSTTLLAGGNGFEQVYLNKEGAISRVSVSTAGVIGGSDSTNPMLDDNGGVVTFDSKANNLVVGDTGFRDSFFRRAGDYGVGNSLDAFATQVSTGFGYRTPAAIAASIRAGASPEHVIIEAANAPAFAGKRPALIRLYFAYFRRLPDASGLTYWTNKLTAGMPLDRVSASFAGSSEFKAKYGDKTNGQFVTLIYQNIFDRNPDASGLAYWTKRLDQGTSRGTVMTNFSESSEGRRKLQVRVDLALFPLGLFGSLPTSGYLNGLLSGVASAGGASEGAVRWAIGE
jgi:Tol biopolymer transport system component